MGALKQDFGANGHSCYQYKSLIHSNSALFWDVARSGKYAFGFPIVGKNMKHCEGESAVEDEQNLNFSPK